jgi:hypothetical protein
MRAAEEAYLSLRKVPGGFRCRYCGGIERNPFLLYNNHGIPGARCLAETFARNHTLYDLRAGDRARYMESSARLRRIAAWAASLRVPF